jgi:hypothetical protein
MLALRALISEKAVGTMDGAVTRSQSYRLMERNLATLLTLALSVMASHILHHRRFAMVASLRFAFLVWYILMRMLGSEIWGNRKRIWRLRLRDRSRRKMMRQRMLVLRSGRREILSNAGEIRKRWGGRS